MAIGVLFVQIGLIDLDKDGNIDKFHYQSIYHDGRGKSIEAKVWCSFCGNAVIVTMYEEVDSWGLPKGSYETWLSHRDPEHNDLPSSYSIIHFPAIPKERERYQLESAKKDELKRKTQD